MHVEVTELHISLSNIYCVIDNCTGRGPFGYFAVTLETLDESLLNVLYILNNYLRIFPNVCTEEDVGNRNFGRKINCI